MKLMHDYIVYKIKLLQKETVQEKLIGYSSKNKIKLTR